MSLAEKALGLFVRTHDALYQRTNGWIGHRIPGAPNSLLLHTVGAKTGQPRTTTLSYSNDGNDYLVVASMGGAPSSSKSPAIFPPFSSASRSAAREEMRVARRVM